MAVRVNSSFCTAWAIWQMFRDLAAGSVTPASRRDRVIPPTTTQEIDITTKTHALACVATTVALVGTVFAATTQEEAAYRAQDAYLAEINSNDLDTFLSTVTDDIISIAPNSQVMVGKT